MPNATILLIEDDPEIALTLRDVLEARSYHVEHADTGAVGEEMVESIHPDLVILDLMLPDADGLVLCANIKAKMDVPIIICSATVRKRDSVLGFKLGADDFVPKPFEPAELEARVEAVLRRAAQSHAAADGAPAAGDPADLRGLAPIPAGGAERIRIGQLEIDNSRRSVTLGGSPVSVTPTESRLLRALASRPEQVLSREELAEQVWGYQDSGISRAMDVHMRRLRAKLAEGPVPSPPIVSVRGFGFKITQEAE
jgi:two-component system response regulator MtrA